MTIQIQETRTRLGNTVWQATLSDGKVYSRTCEGAADDEIRAEVLAAYKTWEPDAEFEFIADEYAAKLAESDARFEAAEKVLDGAYIQIRFQEGPIKEVGVNGCQIEDVIDVLRLRLAGFQNGKYPCDENAAAIGYLNAAWEMLAMRTRARLAQGVEGTRAAHNTDSHAVDVAILGEELG